MIDVGWQDILKVKPLLSGSQKDLEDADKFADLIRDLLEGRTHHFDRYSKRVGNSGKDWWGVNLLAKDYDLNNPNDIIEISNKIEDWDIDGDFKFGYVDFDNPAQVTHFLKAMKARGYNMEAFKSKGLLTQGSSKTSPQKQDYTNRIKETIKVLRNMNKPITEETIMYELDMEEGDWDDKYNELIQ